MKSNLLHWGITIFQGMLIGFIGIWIIVFAEKSYLLPGIILLLAGIAGIAEWQFSDAFNRSNTDFMFSIFTAISGLVLLTSAIGETNLQIIVCYGWMIVSGILLSVRGWELRWVSGLSRAMLAVGVIISFYGLFLGFHTQEITSAVWKSALLFLIAISLVALAIIKKKIFESF